MRGYAGERKKGFSYQNGPPAVAKQPTEPPSALRWVNLLSAEDRRPAETATLLYAGPW
jgi:hypothetical protein